MIQPTEFCNIDCRYCYLPHRARKSRMPQDVLVRVFHEAFTSAAVVAPLTFLWHLGEPLAVSRSFYEEAFALADAAAAAAGSDRPYGHEFQTNATLLDAAWIDFIKARKVSIGLSLDGPEFIHDKMRVTRNQTGTHASVMRGIDLLQKAGLPFTTICVLTTHSLDYPDAMFDFFEQNGVRDIGFNIDEMEGSNNVSSFQNGGDAVRYRKFIRRFIERIDLSNGAVKLREVWSHLPKIIARKDNVIKNSTNTAFQIVNVDVDGGISTFCPELVTASATKGRSFTLGNIRDMSLAEMSVSEKFRALSAEIQVGKDKCRNECEYWGFCGGGAPANKFFETGRFDVSETMACRLEIKENVNALVEYLESKIAHAV